MTTPFIQIPELVVDVKSLLDELDKVTEWQAGGRSWPVGVPHPTKQEGRFEISRNNQLFNPAVIAITDKLAIKPTYALFMRTLPGQASNKHIDELRFSALNINLDEHYGNSKVDFYESLTSDNIIATKVHTDHQATLYDVKMPHQTVNVGLENRYVLTLSYQTPFADLVQLYKDGKLLKV